MMSICIANFGLRISNLLLLKFAIRNSQFQESFRRIDANQFLLHIDADTDLVRHRNQEITSRVVFDDQNFYSARSHHRGYAAYEVSVNGLDATPFQFPFVKLILS